MNGECDTAYEQALDKIVNQWVFYNHTILINEVIKLSDIQPSYRLINYDDIENAYDRIQQYTDEVITQKEWEELPEEDEDGIPKEDAYNYQDKEVLQWWLVDRYLADRLFEKGEAVIRTIFGNWWGRTCYGQAISMDYVIEEIAKEIAE